MGNLVISGGDDAVTATVTSLPNEGQQTMANSISVVVASDQSAIPVSGPLTDAQLRAAPVVITGAVIVL